MHQTLFFLRKSTTAFSVHPTCFFLRFLLLCLALLATTATYAQQPFITTWKTDNPGSSNSTSITIPTNGGGYNYEVDWDNNGTYEEIGITGNVTHDFGAAGTRTIRIRGTFPRIYFNNTGDCQKLLSVVQWGDIAWTSMNSAFRGCSNLNIGSGEPNLSGVTDMAGMFANCSSLTASSAIGNWNTSTITNMGSVFDGASSFNRSLNSWNTTNVTNMSQMFRNASSFNQLISNWNTANVTVMASMFAGATDFNRAIGGWNTGNVITMASMFSGATSFNQPIGTWNTANVANMSNMFSDATSFNQAIGTWNTINVTNAFRMFAGATAFNQAIGTWNTFNVLNMVAMFAGATSFNQPIDNWNTINVTNMTTVFQGASAFNQPIDSWNTGNVTSMANMFNLAIAFNRPIDNWNVVNVTNMTGMFNDATAFNQSLGNWTLNAAVNLTSMLDNSGLDCDHYSATLFGWDANAATPNGCSLGAAGRQYGTSVVAARTNLTAIKGWTISGDAASGAACALVLPVILVNFTGKQQTNGILLEWQTASEQNNAGFHVERSADGLRWTDIGFVAGKGTTTERLDYEFLDAKPQTGTNYYRLRQTDFNGKEELSKVVTVALKNIGQVRVFPNPVTNGELTLFLPENTEGEITVQLFNPAGQLLRSTIIGSGTTTLNVSGLAAGVYTLQVKSGQESTVEKIVVEH